VIDALPAHVGDVEQAVDAAQVNECAVIGDVLDDAVTDFTLDQLADEFSALLGAGFFQDGAARRRRYCRGGRSILRIGEGLFLAHERADVADRTDVHLAARQEGRRRRRGRR